MIKTDNSLEFSLSQKQSHVLALRQQQSLKLLQLSAVELNQALNEVAERNPFLDVKQNDENLASFEDLNNAYDLYDNDISSHPVEITPDENTKLESNGRLSQSDFILKSSAVDPFFENDAKAQSLHDSLLFELNLASLSVKDKEIGEWLIDGIDDDGFLQTRPEDIAFKLSCTEDEVLSVLKLIQHFDPRGVGSRNVKEFLLLQLKDESSSSLNSLCIMMLEQYEDLVIRHDFKGLKNNIKCDDETLKKALTKLASLKPRPYIQIAKSQELDVIPDLIVQRGNLGFKVELNTDKLPKVFINKKCLKLRRQAKDPKDIRFFKDNFEEAKFIISGLSRRYETLLNLGQFIFKRQENFLLSGKNALIPLTLKECALALGVHESTVSRAISQKYVLTPLGTFPLKSFFAVKIKNIGGKTDEKEKSGTAVLALIENLIKNEDKRKPLSDSKIVMLLEKEGISIARRTVAKYREKLRIAPASERKSIF